MGKIHEYPLEATVLQDTDFADLDAFNSGTGLFQSKKISGLNLKDSVLTFITPNLDARDTANRDRANHTGTQDASTITGLAVVATSNDYNDLDNLPVLLTAHSELILDDGTNPHGTTATDVGLGNVDNTSDLNKPISTATQLALDDKQDELISGVNIKTVDGQSILGAGDIPIASNIEVGVTPVISGTDNRVFFQSGGVVAQDANFVWDNTNKRLGVGASPASTVRLDVRAQGALSTDIAFRVRNSANNADIFSVTGNGVLFKPHASANNDTSQNVFVSEMVDGRNKIRLFTKGSFNASAAIGISFQSDAAGNNISSYTLAGASILNNNSYKDNGDLSIFHVGGGNVTQYSYLQLRNNTNSATNIYISRTGTIILNPDNVNSQVRGLAIFGGTLGTTADRVIAVGNGTSPTTSTADNFQFWSADIVAGNAAPHFRTENGSVIKLYQETTSVGDATFVANTGNNIKDDSTFDGYTVKQVVQALKNLGILA
jgi:hypothetical protein